MKPNYKEMSTIKTSIKKSNDYNNPIGAIDTKEKSLINSNLCHNRDYLLHRRKFHCKALSENFDFIKGDSVDKDKYNYLKNLNDINRNNDNNNNCNNLISKNNTPLKNQVNLNRGLLKSVPNFIENSDNNNNNNNKNINIFNTDDNNNNNNNGLPFISETVKKENNLNKFDNSMKLKENNNNKFSIIKNNKKNNTNNNNSYNLDNFISNTNDNLNHEILDDSNNLFNVKNRRFLKKRLYNPSYNEK